MLASSFPVRLPGLVVLAAAVLRSTTAQALPRETSGLPPPTLAAAASAQSATPAPTSPAQLRGRDSQNTVCGYIGGDPALPATCTEGSHCAVDVQHGIMGCCADGHECTRGIFTACVDKNSSPQTLKDPYVFTCQGADVCYRNLFDGGFYQFGCGSASRLATNVATTASGRAPLDVSQVVFALTESPTPLATPVVLGSLSSSPSSGPAQASSLGPSAPSPVSEADAPPRDARSPSTGAIVGGIFGGLAALALLIGLCIIIMRRRKGQARRQSTHYISPMSDANHRFEPLPSSQSAGPDTAMRHRPLGSSNLAAAPYSESSDSPQPSYLDDGAHPNGAKDKGEDRQNVALDQVPLTGEASGLSPSRETARATSPENDNATLNTVYSSNSYPGPRRNGGGALWQQNRRPRRNLWI